MPGLMEGGQSRSHQASETKTKCVRRFFERDSCIRTTLAHTTTPRCEQARNVSSSNLPERQSRQRQRQARGGSILIVAPSDLTTSPFRASCMSTLRKTTRRMAQDAIESVLANAEPFPGHWVDLKIRKRIGHQQARRFASEIALYHPPYRNQSPT